MQGSKGIRQWPIFDPQSPKIIHKTTPSVDDRFWLKCLDTQFNKTTNNNSIKVTKVVISTNKKTYSKYFGDLCNKQPNVS